LITLSVGLCPQKKKPEAEKPEERLPATAEIEHPEDVGKAESNGPAPAGTRSWRELKALTNRPDGTVGAVESQATLPTLPN
jgi:hypothetical protein